MDPFRAVKKVKEKIRPFFFFPNPSTKISGKIAEQKYNKISFCFNFIFFDTNFCFSFFQEKRGGKICKDGD